MPDGRRLGRVLALVLTTLAASPARPHAPAVFAYAEGAQIRGSVELGGHASGAARILVKDAGGNTLARLSPTADGSFNYQAQRAVEHLIVAEWGDGHQAQWRVSAAELAAGFADRVQISGMGAAAEPAGAGGQVATNAGERAAVSNGHPELDPGVEAAIGLAVARQIGPLRQELAASRERLRLQDVLGGIGYIIGLAGLTLWWRCQRSQGAG
jgi:nickel transport protein